MKRKAFCLFLAFLVCALTFVPALAVEKQEEKMSSVAVTASDPGTGEAGPVLRLTRPAVPSDFYSTSYATLTGNKLVDVAFAIVSGCLTAIITAGFGLTVSIVSGGLVSGLQELGSGSRPANTVEYIYEAKNPVRDYQVPYVYWHLIKYTISTSEGDVVFYQCYYEYAVMPKTLPTDTI